MPWVNDVVQGVITGGTDLVIKGISLIVTGLATIVNLLAGIYLNTAGYLLDMSAQLAIYGLSEIVNGRTRQAIIEGWTVFRDLANIGFVFAMLYIAINFILQSDSSSTKKLLSSVIIAAFLVNFSFFFTGIIIDTGNQFAITFANSINQELQAAQPEPATSFSDFINKSTKVENVLTKLSAWTDNFMAIFKNSLSGGIGSGAATIAAQQAQQKSDFKNALESGIASVGALAVMFILGTVFLIVAGMLFARTVALILLLITSPLGFAGNIIPQLKKASDEWWESLIGNVFFLPAFFLFIYIAFKLMNSGILNFEGANGTSTFSQPLFGSGSTTGAETSLLQTLNTIQGSLATYAIVIGLILGALQAAQKLSSQGSKAISNLSANITSRVGGAVMGGAAFAGRNTLGRMARGALASDTVQNLAAKNKILGGLALRGLDGIAGGSMDVRGTSAFQGVATATGVGANVLGKAGGKDGIKGQDKWLSGQYAKTADLITLGPKREALVRQRAETIENNKRKKIETEIAKASTDVSNAQTQLNLARKYGDQKGIQQFGNQLAEAKTRLKTQESALAERKKKKIEEILDGAVKESIKKQKRVFARELERTSGSNLSKLLGIDVAQGEAADKIKKGVKASATDRAWDTLKAEMAKASKNNP